MRVLPMLLIAGFACTSETAREPVPVEQQAPPPEPTPAVVETPPPPPPALAVSPRRVRFDALGDTLRLALPAGADCRSATPSVASVDAYGLVRALTNGVTHLWCRGAGEATASVRVTVDQAVARIAITAEEGLEIAHPGDTLRLGLAKLDRLGTTVEHAQPAWASLQPEVVQVDAASGVAVGVADSGFARVVASVDGLADTVTVELGRKIPPLLTQSSRSATSRAARNAALRRAAPTSRRTTTGPVADRRVGLNTVGVRDIQPSDSLDFQDPLATARAPRSRTLNPYAVATMADHGVTDAGGQPLERTSGVVFGVGADVMTRGWLRASFQIGTGTLAAETPAARDQTVTDGRFDLGIAAFQWLTLNAGVQSRVYEDITSVRWVMVRTGGELKFNLGDTPLSGIASLNLLPYISRGEGNTAPNFGMNTAFGVGFERGRFSAALRYFLESYGFPSQGGVAAREEQYSGLEFRLGLLFGW